MSASSDEERGLGDMIHGYESAVDSTADDSTAEVSWRYDYMPLLNFGLVVGTSLLLIHLYIQARRVTSSGHATTYYKISPGPVPNTAWPWWAATERHCIGRSAAWQK